MALPKKAINTILTDLNRTNPDRKPVVLACSGGVDSMSLFFCLSLSKIPFHPVFVYHGMRSRKEEERSLKAVQDFANTFDLRVKTCKPPQKTIANESDARSYRYSCLGMIAKGLQVYTVATAHHADDQLETTLMRLCRGTGLHGLAGIPMSSQFPSEEYAHLRVIRPQLRISKTDCIEICTENHVSWHEDSTNSDMKITRNRLRKDVLPVLKELYPQASLHASEMSFKLREVSSEIDFRVKRLKTAEFKYELGIWIENKILDSETDQVQGAYFRDVANRLNNNSGMDRINTRMIEQLVESVKTRQVKTFNWRGMNVRVQLGSVSFEPASENQN